MSVQKNDESSNEAKFMREQVREMAKTNTLAAKAYAALRDNIISGLHRPGEKLRIEHLKPQYGVSSGTLRAALTMLVADELVVAEGQRGFRVALVTAQDLLDLSQIRILLEKEAIKQSIAHGDEVWEGNIVSSFHILGRATKAFAENPRDKAVFDEWESRHRAFHLALIAAAPSGRMREYLANTYQQYARYRHLFLAVAEEFYKDRDAQDEHSALVDAVLSRNADSAAQLIEEHLTRSTDEWVGYFEKIRALEGDSGAPGSRKAGKRRGRA